MERGCGGEEVEKGGWVLRVRGLRGAAAAGTTERRRCQESDSTDEKPALDIASLQFPAKRHRGAREGQVSLIGPLWEGCGRRSPELMPGALVLRSRSDVSLSAAAGTRQGKARQGEARHISGARCPAATPRHRAVPGDVASRGH